MMEMKMNWVRIIFIFSINNKFHLNNISKKFVINIPLQSPTNIIVTVLSSRVITRIAEVCLVISSCLITLNFCLSKKITHIFILKPAKRKTEGTNQLIMFNLDILGLRIMT